MAAVSLFIEFNVNFTMIHPACSPSLCILGGVFQPIAQQQESYLKDNTDFVNFIKTTKVPVDTTLVTLNITSLYTNLPKEEGIFTIYIAYEMFYDNEPPIHKRLPEKRAL